MNPDITPAVLAIVPNVNDQISLQNAFQNTAWRLLFVPSLLDALHHPELARVPALICSQEWKKALDAFSGVPNGPKIIVASRFADERLWEEVLTCGGYDVLSLPCDRQELFRSLNLAGRQRKQAARRQNGSTRQACA